MSLPVLTLLDAIGVACKGGALAIALIARAIKFDALGKFDIGMG